jgi:hypothetical protein
MKNEIVNQETVANQSSEVNANAHVGKETRSITTKLSDKRRTLNRWSVRKIVFCIGIIMFIAAGVFYACKKEETSKESISKEKTSPAEKKKKKIEIDKTENNDGTVHLDWDFKY